MSLHGAFQSLIYLQICAGNSPKPDELSAVHTQLVSAHPAPNWFLKPPATTPAQPWGPWATAQHMLQPEFPLVTLVSQPAPAPQGDRAKAALLLAMWKIERCCRRRRVLRIQSCSGKPPVPLPAPPHPGGSAFAWTDPAGSKGKSKAQQGHGRLSPVPSCRSSIGSPKPPHGTGRSDVRPRYPVC